MVRCAWLHGCTNEGTIRVADVLAGTPGIEEEPDVLCTLHAEALRSAQESQRGPEYQAGRDYAKRGA